MDKWEDTVMNAVELSAIWNDLHYQKGSRLGYVAEHQAEITWPIAFKAGEQQGIKLVARVINDSIIGVDNCKFKERFDGNKGCIVLDMNENQWQAFLKERGK